MFHVKPLHLDAYPELRLISIDALNKDVLYLSLLICYNLTDDFNLELASKVASEAASDKPVCSMVDDNSLCFSCEMYAKDEKSFIDVFPEMLQALNSSADSFNEEYHTAKITDVPKANVGVRDVGIKKNEYVFPKTNSSDKHLYIKKVSITPEYTILDMVSYNGGEYQWCSISNTSYLSVYGKKYYIKKAEGIAYAPEHTDYPNYDSGNIVSLPFKLYFSPLPLETDYFDFSEGEDGSWKISNVELKHGESFTLNSECLETSVHKWTCTNIELQDGQTILTKTVTPLDEGTYIYSNQSEYIEDADTGRKYYLTNSSIGFEGSPIITYDKNTIIFYEVYPALPAAVRRINISSGSAYYIKDLNIR